MYKFNAKVSGQTEAKQLQVKSLVGLKIIKSWSLNIFQKTVFCHLI